MKANHAVSAATEPITAAPVSRLRRGAFLGYRWVLLAFLLTRLPSLWHHP